MYWLLKLFPKLLTLTDIHDRSEPLNRQGRPLNLYAKQQVLKPLGMSHSAWFLSELKAEQHSKLYVSQHGMTIPIPLYQITTYPVGGVRTSVSDWSRFFIALLQGGEYQGIRILDKK